MLHVLKELTVSAAFCLKAIIFSGKDFCREEGIKKSAREEIRQKRMHADVSKKSAFRETEALFAEL